MNKILKAKNQCLQFNKKENKLSIASMAMYAVNGATI